jgi:CpeT protein
LIYKPFFHLKNKNTMLRTLLVGGIFCAFFFQNCASSVAHRRDQANLQVLANLMIGDFSSQAQSQRDSDYFDIRLHIRPIWTADKTNTWLYVEQATAAAEHKPYRQRVYKLEAANGVYKSIVYTFAGDPLAWAGKYKTPEAFDALKPADLVLREGCTVFLTKKGDDFVGATNGVGCESTLRGAKYASSKVTVTPKMLLSWDQGFDAADKQVWGAEKGGYEFVKQ